VSLRREFIAGLGMASLASAAKAVTPGGFGGVVFQSVGGALTNPLIRPASAFFPAGSGLSSLSLTGRTNLPGMPNSQSSSVNIAKTLYYDYVPASPQRLFTSILPDTSFENVTLDLLPPGTQYYIYHPQTKSVTQTAFGTPSVYLKAAATAGATIGFFAALAAFPLGTWFEILLLLNDVTVTGAVAGVKIFQFFKGQPPSNSNQLVSYIGTPVGQTPPSGGLTLVQFPIFTGYSGGPIQSDVTIGINPLTGTGGLSDTVVGSVVYSPQAANPNVAISSAINSNGTIPRFGAGAPNFFASYTGTSSVALIGEVDPNVPGSGFQENSGDASMVYVNGNWTSLDTRFADTNAGIPVEPADILYYSDPFQ
jgi:hypothetical protein